MACSMLFVGTLTSLACVVYAVYKLKNQFTEDL